MGELKEVRTGHQVQEEPIEGGYVGELRELEFHETKHRADTARRLAYLLVLILALSIGLHYVATIVLILFGKADATENLSKIFNVWLPVISSLVSAAATYYFTRERP